MGFHNLEERRVHSHRITSATTAWTARICEMKTTLCMYRKVPTAPSGDPRSVKNKDYLSTWIYRIVASLDMLCKRKKEMVTEGVS